MKILLTNDDGIYAGGIKALQEALVSSHEVFMVAPEKEMSASGHAITLHKPLRVEEISPGYGTGSWAVNGTPSDCVKLAIEAILPERPQVVISGINRGPNLGNDVFYSGTVSAALEGYFLGLPALAVSLVVGSHCDHPDYDYAANFVNGLLNSLEDMIMSKNLILNINIPDMPTYDIKGVQLTRLSRRSYVNVFDRRVDPRGRVYYWMAGEVEEKYAEEGTDSYAVYNGFVSITPLSINLTDNKLIDEMKKIRF